MDKLIKASLIASVVTIGGNTDNNKETIVDVVTNENTQENNGHEQEEILNKETELNDENKNEKTELKNKNKKKFDKESSFVKFITCDNCFRGFGGKKNT